MTRPIDRPNDLAPFLDTNASTWQRILGVDASGLAMFGRVSALTHGWLALQRAALNHLGINYAELTVLGMLRVSEHQRGSPTELRARVGQSSAGTTRILDKLEADGHLRREDIDGDRRRVDIVLTPSGAALAEAGVAAMLAAETAVLAPLSPEHRTAIRAGLDALLGAFAAYRRR
ncbi:MAG: MarR family transcriptional regulator [Deltaproteobacteria bacterium]|nr:MAG: MarR family transcriptional regulator [Deltaproteobacteria bacterium]